MKRPPSITLLIGWIAVALMPSHGSRAADSGTAAAVASTSAPALAGIVTNSATGRTLEGARVVLVGTGRETVTDDQGVYRFENVPPGRVELAVSYTGLDTKMVPFEVTTSGRNHIDVGLTADIYTMGRFVVSGEREGTAQAITLQRLSSGVKNIVSQDAFGNFAGNAAELLVRLPGVTGIRQEDGDIRFVQVRGIDGNLSSVMKDGNRTVDASSGANRQYLYQQATSDSVDRFEVTKSPTPDMDADSIGGAVNMISRSAFDNRGERRISATAGLLWRVLDNVRAPHPEPSYSISYSEVFKDKLGISFSFGRRKHYHPNIIANSNYANILAPTPAYLISHGTNDFRIAKERIGGDIKLDFKLSDRTRFSLSTSHSAYTEHFFSSSTSYSTANAATSIVPGYTATVTEWQPIASSTLSANAYDAVIKKGAWHSQFEGKHRLEGLEIDYNVYEAGANMRQTREQMALIVRNIGLRFARSAPGAHPVTITQTAGPDITKIGSYAENNFTISESTGDGDIWGASLNVKKSFATVVPTWIKAGLRIRNENRDATSPPWTGPYVGRDGVMGVNPATGVNDDNLAQFVNPNPLRTGDFLDQYPRLPYASPPNHKRNPGPGGNSPNVNVGRLFMSNPELFKRNIAADLTSAFTGDTDFTEKVSAAYVMGNVEIGKLAILGGVRVEKTHTHAEGALNQITPEEAARRAAFIGPLTDAEIARRTTAQYSARRTASGDNRSVFPGLHFKYSPQAGLVMRASYATNIGRPPIGTLIPNTTVNDELMTVSTSNPSLRPQFANNFDVSAEYYFEPAGMISVGAFLKEMNGFIYTQGGIQVPAGADNGFGGDYAGYTLTTQRNGGTGKTKGIEFAYQQQFTFLPGLWKGFGAYASYTRQETTGDYGAIGTVRSTNELPNFIPETANFGLSYVKNKVSVRVLYNWRSSFLVSYSPTTAALTYGDEASTVDIKTTYQLSNRIGLYLDVLNIFNDPHRSQYRHGGRANYLSQVTSPMFAFGVTGRY